LQGLSSLTKFSSRGNWREGHLDPSPPLKDGSTLKSGLVTEVAVDNGIGVGIS